MFIECNRYMTGPSASSILKGADAKRRVWESTPILRYLGRLLAWVQCPGAAGSPVPPGWERVL